MEDRIVRLEARLVKIGERLAEAVTAENDKKIARLTERKAKVEAKLVEAKAAPATE